MAPPKNDPKHIDISLSQGVTIAWSDGHESKYTLEYLRNNCPCAMCRNDKKSSTPSSPFPMFKPTASLKGAEAVGRYAVQFHWTDGHNTGIYSFDHLREICPCPQCQSEPRP